MEEKKFLHRTENMKQAAALMAQKEIAVRFVGVEPTDDPRILKFVIEVEKDKLDSWISRYINEETLVEPKTYDSKMDIIRDNIRIYTKKSRGYRS